MWCAGQEIFHYKDEYADTQPRLTHCEEKLAVARGRSVWVHDRVTFREILKLNFESEINCLSWTDDSTGRFLLVTEHAGLLHTVHCASQRVINSERIYQTSNDEEATVQQLLFLPETNSLYTLGSGELHCFTNLDYSTLDDALCQGSMAKALGLRKQIAHTTTTIPLASSLIPDIHKPSIFLLGPNCSLTRLDYSDSTWEAESMTTLQGYGNITAGFRVTPLYLLTLTDQGALMLWNSMTCTAVRIWADHKLKAVGRLTPVCNSISECKLVAHGQLYGREDDSLAILSLPKCDVIYSQPASDVTLALDYTGQLSIPYISRNDSKSSHLASISLISAQARCDMMLSKHQFKEALSFATSNQLDVQKVYEEWALSLSSIHTLERESVRFVACLDMLSDIHRVTDICLASISSPGKVDDSHSLKAIIDTVLRYALKRLDKDEHKCQCDRMTQVLKALQRFETFSAFASKDFTLEGWHSFLTCDLGQEIHRLAKSQSAMSAMMVWSRHKCQIQRHMSVDWLDGLLESLSPILDSNKVCEWLGEHLVPFIDRNEQVSFCELLAKHLERLVRDYELSDKESWPQNSIILCSLLDKFKSVVLSPSLSKLRLLKENLKAIEQLKNVYHCSLSYAQYCEQTNESIVHRLLDVVNVPSIFRHHYETVAAPYMAQSCIHADRNLLLYVKDLISRYKYDRGYDSTGLLWEQKAVEVVGCMKIASYKVRATIELAKHCHAPWSKCIAALVESTCCLTTEDLEELKVIKCRSTLSHLLASYDVPKEVIPSSTNVLMILKYILKHTQASVTGLRHALQVGEALKVDEQKVYLLACQTRLMSGLGVLDILEEIPKSIERQVKTRLVSQCVQLFTDQSGISWDIKAQWMCLACSILCAEPQNVDDRHFHLPLSELSSQLRALVLLKREFGLEFSLSIFNSPEQKINHLSTLITSIVKSQPSDSNSDSSDSALQLLEVSMWRLEAFSHHCQISKSQLYQAIYSIMWEITPTSAAGVLRLVADRDTTGETIKFLLTKSRELMEGGHCSVSNARQLLMLSQKAVTSCWEDDLLEACTQLNLLRYHFDVMFNCLGTEDHQEMTSFDEDKAELENLFTKKHHQEADLIVNTSLVSSLTNQWMACLLSKDNKRLSITDCERYMGLLKSNNYELLVIRMSLHLYYNSAAFITTESIAQLLNFLCSELKATLSVLLPKLLSHRNLDVHLTLAALLDMSPRASLSLAKKSAASFGSQFLRIMSLTNVALVISQHYKQTESLERCLLLKQEAIWGHVLAKHGVNYLSVFGKANKGQLLQQVACKCPLEVIDRYISDFSLGCDADKAYLTRVQSLAEKHCQTEFWLDSKEGMGLLKEISTLLTAMNSTEDLIDSLVEACNPYNYSLIQTLLSFCEESSSKKEQLLNFLTLYTRQSVPSEWERSLWKELSAGKGDNALPPISATRLPYQPLLSSDVWKILRPELSAKTFEVLLPIATLLEIKRDVYLLNAALQIAELHIGALPKQGDAIAATNNTSNWSTDEVVDSKFVADIVVALAAIQDKHSAVMCSQTLINKLPNGTEKVLVSRVCLDLARDWRQSCEESSEEYALAHKVLRKVSSLYSTICLEQRLYQSGLASESFLSLIPYPSQLIQGILETTHADSSQRAAEKFEVCQAIADLAGKDIAQVCYEIISDSWLCLSADVTQSHIDMEMTMTLDLGSMMPAALDQSINEDPVRSADKEKWIVHLANSSIGPRIVHLLNNTLARQSSDNKTKLLVIRCFLLLGDAAIATLSNEDSPQHHIEWSNEQLTKQYKALQYIERLRTLNISMTVDEYYSCDMSSLLIRLRKNYTSNPQAIELCADLCIETDNYEVIMWRSLLQQMVQLNMVDKLAEVLAATADQIQLWTLQVYTQAWQLLADKSHGTTGYETALSCCPVAAKLR
ncbi:kinetochore-associated protein 1-like [Watersipora subatra]|uniref:kinetochore-associated protein 1-like n=1 Tax=Watersipora subatra TaxID=2589382 RepID=UPI00355BEA85